MFSQIFAITGVNLKSIPERWGPSLVIVIGLVLMIVIFPLGLVIVVVRRTRWLHEQGCHAEVFD